MKTKECFTELAIQIATLDMKINKVLELLNVPETTIDQDIRFVEGLPGHGASWVGVMDALTTPKQWPNESYTDYLKRIGQYNEAQSDNDKFEEFK